MKCLILILFVTLISVGVSESQLELFIRNNDILPRFLRAIELTVDIRTLCIALQTNEVYFTNKCSIKSDSDEFIKNMDLVKNYVNREDDSTTIYEFFRKEFNLKTAFFKSNYPQYSSNYSMFERLFIQEANKMNKSTDTVKLEAFRPAIFDSGMDKVYQELTKAQSVRPCLEGNANVPCDGLKEFLMINEKTVLSSTIQEFLVNSSKNLLESFKKSYNDDLENDEKAIFELLDSLNSTGTLGTTMKLLKPVFNGDFYQYFSYEIALKKRPPTKKPKTTTQKTTKAVKLPQVVVIPEQPVKAAIYLSVSISILAFGIAGTALIIVLVYHCIPIKGGSRRIFMKENVPNLIKQDTKI